MTTLDVLSTHGSRNDILVVELPEGLPITTDLSRVVRNLCDRTGPLGADGVYFVEDPTGAAEALFYNPDGSRSSLCGNGMRCLGRYVLDRRAEESATVSTGPHRFLVERAAGEGGVPRTAVSLPPVSFHAPEPIVAGVHEWFDEVIPALGSPLGFTALAVPNSHLIAIVDHYDEKELVSVGRRVEALTETFPIGANVSFVQPLGEHEIFVCTFERGVGLTLSCGSGVIASSAVYSKLRGIPAGIPLTVRNPGGVAKAVFRDEGGRWHPTLEGNATFVSRATVSLEEAEAGPDFAVDTERFDEEIAAYAELDRANRARLAELGVTI
ncbi:diaminopimelate epimerase [Sinosporangium siamense]|uniref:Diaminopimelate epimerase n=1 Tax=Sinosporangium siamense TaxID=1367973 RepID=A0A919VBQ7_9ACTN|nr:diaminopimelate epimerase [Sinosporangium siamense]GII92374.1 diaminopimelate epimerase [Sinosporangium siamense]